MAVVIGLYFSFVVKLDSFESGKTRCSVLEGLQLIRPRASLGSIGAETSWIRIDTSRYG